MIPKKVNELTGYSAYGTCQLKDATIIKSYRQLGLSIDEIKEIISGADKRKLLASKAEILKS